jgi:hypothetical protein
VKHKKHLCTLLIIAFTQITNQYSSKCVANKRLNKRAQNPILLLMRSENSCIYAVTYFRPEMSYNTI